jgi:hypothetical protein
MGLRMLAAVESGVGVSYMAQFRKKLNFPSRISYIFSRACIVVGVLVVRVTQYSRGCSNFACHLLHLQNIFRQIYCSMGACAENTFCDDEAISKVLWNQ